MENTRNKCILKWSHNGITDEKIDKAYNLFDTWFSSIPKEYRSLSLTLVENLEYFTHSKANTILKKLYEDVIKTFEINIHNTIFTYIKSKDGITNSSNDYWTEFKFLNGISKNVCIENLSAIENEDWLHIDNVIFIDDFSGTGKSFIDWINNFTDVLENKNIILITILIMEEAIERINKFASDNNFNFYPISSKIQIKSFDRKEINMHENAKEKYDELSEFLELKKHNYLGYQESQALVAFHNNTPNNTLSIIWEDTKNNNALFSRVNDKLPEWQIMRKQRNRRSAANYRNKIRENN